MKIGKPGDRPRRPRTDSDDEISRALRESLNPGPPIPGGKPAAADDAVPYRPSRRPPTALLRVLDDGLTTGEDFRLRADEYVIGRSEGDIRIPHDGMMSARHAKLSRQMTKAGWRWVLHDFDSTNGVFARVESRALEPGTEFRVGGGHFRFEAADMDDAAFLTGTPGSDGRTIDQLDSQSLLPSLVELIDGGEAGRVKLSRGEYAIGRDPGCDIARPDDRHLSRRHARLTRDADGRWRVANEKSADGVWVRVGQLFVSAKLQFQLGEQRFSLKVL